MSDFVVHPTLKFVKLGYICAGLAAVTILVYNHGARQAPEPSFNLLLVIPAFVALLSAYRHLERAFTRLSIQDGKLRYESGILSKSTRTMEITKVQDVRVDQTVGQRILGIGNLTLETAGESSRLTIGSIDAPQQAADHILEMAHRGGSTARGQKAAGDLH